MYSCDMRPTPAEPLHAHSEPPRSTLTRSLIAAAYDSPAASHPPRTWLQTRRARRRLVRSMGKVTDALMLDVCRPYETFASALDGALTLYAHYGETIALLTDSRAPRPAPSSIDWALRRDGILLHRLIADDPVLRTAIADADFFQALDPDSPFGEVWSLLCDRFAHRALDGIDLACPRFGEDPRLFYETLIRLGTASVPASDSAADRTLTRWTRLIARLGRRRAIAREVYLHTGSFLFAHMRHELIRLAVRATDDGRLGHYDTIWSMDCAGVRALDNASSD